MLIPVSEKIFKEEVKIRFDNINDGFNRFQNAILVTDNNNMFEKNIIGFLQKLIEINGEENCYVDFYYNKLDEHSKKRLLELLDEEDRRYLNKFVSYSKNDSVYFKITKEDIPFITRLNCREILFCTIYFTKNNCTIWGNYNKKFPVFCESEEILNQYRDISLKFDLKFIN